MIPDRAFFYWGGGEMPWIRRMALQSFRWHHPGWTVELFMEPDSWHAYQDLHGVMLTPVAKGPGETVVARSDIFRYSELAENGGWYFDTDIIFTRSVADIDTQGCDTGICFERTGKLTLMTTDSGLQTANSLPNWFSVASLFAAPKNEFFRAAHDYAIEHPECFSKDGQKSYGTAVLLERFGPLEQAVDEFGNRFFNIPRKAFLPVDWVSVRSLYRSDHVLLDQLTSDPEIYGVHWYGGDRTAAISAKWNNHDLWSDCVLGKLIERYT